MSTSSFLSLLLVTIVARCTTANIEATCKFTGSVQGSLILRGDDRVVHIQGIITGLDEGKHGLHVHQTGNISSSCNASGGHYNSDNVTDDDIKHNFGNIEARADGAADVLLGFTDVGLDELLDTALVVHQNEDDVGKEDDMGKGNETDSGITDSGDSGWLVGCCVVELTGGGQGQGLGLLTTIMCCYYSGWIFTVIRKL